MTMFPVLEVTVFLTLFLACCSAACEKPQVPSHAFSLTGKGNSFDTGDVYELVCRPGYKPEKAHKLICQRSNEWQGTIPDCERSTTYLRWWVLLIVITVILVGVPIGVPRLYFHFNDERHVKRLKLIHRRYGTADYLDTVDVMTGKTSNDLAELVTKDDSYNGSLVMDYSVGPCSYNISPQPLPKKREKASEVKKAYVT